jgi:uncharacterized membrane protein HdeD (DUF308 family)
MNNPQFGAGPRPPSPNIALAIVSLALGIVGVLFLVPTIIFTLCGVISIAFGIASVITGFLARSRAKSDPANWGGGGLAIGGIIAGVLSIIGPIAYIILFLLIWGIFVAASQAGR